MLVGVNNVLEKDDYNPNEHQGQTLEVLVKQLSSLEKGQKEKQARLRQQTSMHADDQQNTALARQRVP